MNVETVITDLSEISGKLLHDIKTLKLSAGAAAAQLPAAAPSVHQEALCKYALRCKQLADGSFQLLQILKVKSGKYKISKSGLAATEIALKSEDM